SQSPSLTPSPSVSAFFGSVKYLWSSWKSLSPSRSASGSPAAPEKARARETTTAMKIELMTMCVNSISFCSIREPASRERDSGTWPDRADKGARLHSPPCDSPPHALPPLLPDRPSHGPFRLRGHASEPGARGRGGSLPRRLQRDLPAALDRLERGAVGLEHAHRRGRRHQRQVHAGDRGSAG